MSEMRHKYDPEFKPGACQNSRRQLMGKRRRRARNKIAAAAGIAVAVLAAVLQSIPAPPDLTAEHPETDPDTNGS